MVKRIAAGIVLLVMAMRSSYGEWKTITADNGLAGNEIQFLAEENGIVWVGTLSGLSKYENGEFSTFVDGVAVWDILKAAPNRHWIGTQGGLMLADTHDAPLIAVEKRPDAEVAVSAGGKERLAVPIRSAGGPWHHLVFTITWPRGQPRFASVSLLVDDQSAQAEQPEWLKEPSPRIASNLTVGGAPGRPVSYASQIRRGWVMMYPHGGMNRRFLA